MSDSESLADVTRGGDRGETLRVLRDILAAAIADCRYAKDLPPLAKQFTDVLDALEAVKPAAEGNSST